MSEPVLTKIEGVLLFPLRRIADERGTILHMLRADSPHFQAFGEIYFSTIYPGVVKGWHNHTRITLNYAVPHGRIKLVLFDARETSATYSHLQELYIGPENYSLVRIPPGVFNGFKCIGTEPAIVANCATEPHDPTEMQRLDPFSNKIPYDWALKNG